MRIEIDPNNNSIARIEEKCVHCGMCLSTCEEINSLPDNGCINCGQCILTCPTGALVVKHDYDKVEKALNNPEKIVVVSTSPAVRVAIGDSFGFAPGEFLEGKLVGALRKLGFDYVFDTTFGADLTIMEEATELINRLKKNKNLPMYTSCCPSWVTFMENYKGADIDYLSTCKSPIGMQASVIKNYFSEKLNVTKDKIVSVFLTPCVSKKSEIKREDEHDADLVLTTSELELLFRMNGIDLSNIEESSYDPIFGKGSGAGLIFGNGGGVMEAALRTTYYLLNHEDAPENFYKLESLRGYSAIKEAEVDLKVFKIKVAVLNEIANVCKYYNVLKNYQFIEVMSCPGGCIGGGGQPKLERNVMIKYRDSRIKSLYENDKNLKIRNSYQNKDVKKIYEEYLENPNSELAHQLLHTTYKDKTKVNN